MAASAKVKLGITDDQCKINGCAADMWSAGTVLHEMLTGPRTFNPVVPYGSVTPAQGRHEWADTVLKLTDSLVSLPSHVLCSCQVPCIFEHPCFCTLIVVTQETATIPLLRLTELAGTVLKLTDGLVSLPEHVLCPLKFQCIFEKPCCCEFIVVGQEAAICPLHKVIMNWLAQCSS